MQDFILTPAQEQQMLDLWNANPNNPPDLKVMTQTLFNNQTLDGRCAEARAVKVALAKHSLQVRTTRDPIKNEIELSEAHKAYIKNYCNTMSPTEMARIIFANPLISALQSETRAVATYVKEVMPPAAFMPGSARDIPTRAYEAPKTQTAAAERVNTYIAGTYVIDKLTPSNKKNLMLLIGYLHTFRFVAQMNNYVTENDRRLAEDAFIRATYDKPDLAQEEIDQYIEYANQVVNGFIVQRRSNQLSQQLEDISGANDESIKISMSLVEAIGKASTEYHQCLQRQQKLLEDLKQKRSKRLEKEISDNASILNLVQAWKAEDTRREMLAHADKEQKAIASEVGKLSTMSEHKARILGLTKNEILYG